jgi:spore coat polysaccharide biosynthesis predicted glycosyltransferase SpsG
MSNSLVIRADANAQMGMGHLMRCLALAQGWKARGGQVTFITACESDGLERSYPDPAGWDSTSHTLAAHLGAWVVLEEHHPEWLEINQDVQKKKIGGGCDATESND